MRDWENESDSGMGDVAGMLGWVEPPDDDGFWFRDDHGPVHDSDLREFVVAQVARLTAELAAANERERKWRRAVVGNYGPNHAWEHVSDPDTAIEFADELRALGLESTEHFTAELERVQREKESVCTKVCKGAVWLGDVLSFLDREIEEAESLDKKAKHPARIVTTSILATLQSIRQQIEAALTPKESRHDAN